MDICCICSKIPFPDLFGTSRKPRQWEIGDLNHARNNRSACRFCSFLVEAYELAYDLPRGHLAKNNKDVRFGFQILARDKHDAGVGEEPWFERLGITVKDPQTGPALWLQFNGVQENCRELPHPFVCVSCTPAEKQPQESTRLMPRQRTFDEIADRKVNYKTVKEWLSICDKEHDGLCRKGTHFQRKLLHSRLKFRLIDVTQREVVVVNKDDKEYVALSYVWGKVMKEESTSFWCNAASNARRIRLPDQLTRTVEDAITFTKRINCKYLWVDAYCINQNDQTDLQTQIANMNLVFECSSLTIAAMEGKDAEAGLCGISKEFNQLWQPRTKIAYGDFMATYVHEMWSPESRSDWETRAWTLQELLLSKRVLFFGQHYLTMKCNSEFLQDLLQVGSDPMRPQFELCSNYFWENGFGVQLHDQEWSFLQYDTFLANYTGRELDDEDILSACRGAFNQITSNTGVGFLQGLPRADLHVALLWKPHHETTLIWRPGFPSWSWTGWVGRVEHHYCLDDLGVYNALGLKKREKQLEKRKTALTLEEEAIINNDTALINEEEDDILQVVSHVARTTVLKVRQKGDEMQGRMKGSEQAAVAVGDQWVLLDKIGKPIANDVGEVARFERVDYSFQVDPKISTKLDQVHGQCELLFIKYFHSLRDCLRKGGEKWLFDYVGCLVTVKSGNHRARIGFVFMTLRDWAIFDRRTEVVNLV